MFNHHYLIVLLALLLFAACGKDTETLDANIQEIHNSKGNPKVPDPGRAPCDYKETFLNANTHIGYYGAHIIHYFRPYETVQYTIYDYWDDRNHKWLAQKGSSLAGIWQMWLSDTHHYVILESRNRCIEIDIRNRLPLPYRITVQSACKVPVSGVPKDELKQY